MSDSATPWTVAYQAPPSTDFPGTSTGVNNTWIEAGGDTPLILGESFWLQIEKLSVWFTKALLQHFSAPFLEKSQKENLSAPPPGSSIQPDFTDSFTAFIFMVIFCLWWVSQASLENPGDGGPWWAAVYGVTQGRTWLKWLSSSSSSSVGFITYIDVVYVTIIAQRKGGNRTILNEVTIILAKLSQY